ncbi:hypothetical protein C7A11_23165 [Pseudomonas simiae]|uniref:hypothetical protein n=1 Tax=Pseudomonas simiae TaxID=321846 RepID=UPI000D026E75|nr:hypothetical protein [Pseudomonas simiae]PRW85426.1 hypothetical protein C7A11_23165 [Pseudomonas simiae]
MTANQTIDGVSRELIEWLVTPGNVMDLGGRREELRTLLDKKVSGDSRAPLPQGESVAVVLPERYDESQYRGTSLLAVRRWNACLDELKRLNPSL